MTEDLLDYWLRMIKPLFPANAWVASRFSGGDHLIQIDWKLESNLCKQNRRSRMIEIVIKEDVIDDYLEKNADERVLSDTHMARWISQRYHDFLLDQDGRPSPSGSPIRWRISKAALNQ